MKTKIILLSAVFWLSLLSSCRSTYRINSEPRKCPMWSVNKSENGRIQQGEKKRIMSLIHSENTPPERIVAKRLKNDIKKHTEKALKKVLSAIK